MGTWKIVADRLFKGLVYLVDQLLALDALEKLHVLPSIRVQIVQILNVVDSHSIFWLLQAVTWIEILGCAEEVDWLTFIDLVTREILGVTRLLDLIA